MEHEQAVYVATSLEQVRVMSHKLRMQILHLFIDYKPRTSKQVADQLELPPAKVHYHMKELHRVGLLLLVDTKEKGGVVEKYYLPVAREIQVALEEESPDALEHSRKAARVRVDEYLDAYKRARDFAIRKAATGDLEASQKLFTGMATLHATLEEKEQIMQEITQLVQKWEQRCNTQREQTEAIPLRLLVALFPNM